MEQAGVQLIAAGGDVYITTLERAEKATNNFVDATDRGGGKVGAFGEIVTGALRRVGEVAVDALGKAAEATAAFIGDSIGLAGDFEAGMLEFQAVAGKGVDTKGLEEFRDLFIDIGKRLPVSTSEVQDAAIELIKGGIEPATIAAGGLESSIKFAAAAMDGDLAGAAQISAKIVGGWAEVNATAAEKATLLASSQDLLTKAANASTVGVQDLSLGLFNVQGNAKLAGMGLDETVTALALLSPNFSSAATAGTSLNAMIARLQPSTKPAQEAMAGLGLWTKEAGSAFYDAQGNFVGWAQTAQILQDTTAGLTDAQKQQTLQTIFGMDAMGAAAELTRLGAAGYDQMAAALANANGVQENAALKQQGYNTALENAKGSVEALQITIGSALLPILTDLLNNVIAPGVNMLTDMADALSGDAEAFNRLSPAAQSVVTTIEDIIAGVYDVMASLEDAGKVLQDVIGWFSKASNEGDSLGGVIEDLSGIWQKAIGIVENVAAGYQDIIDSVLPIVSQFIEEHGDEISAFFQGAYDKVISIINVAMDLYNAIVPPILHAIAGYIDDHASEIQTILSGAWDVITGIIEGALTLIEGLLKTALALINGDWEGAWTEIQDMSVGFVESLGQIIEGFLNIIAGFFGSSLSEIVSTWQHNWDELVRIATQTDWGAVGRDIVDGIIAGLAAAWGSLVDWIVSRMSNLIDQGLEAIGAGSPAKEFMPIGQFSVQGIMEGFTTWWPQLTQLVSGLGEDLVQQAEDLGMAVQSAVANAFGATATIDRQVADNLDKLDKITSDFYRKHAEGALEQARITALGMDPQEGAKFFQMRSKQIFEEADLKERLAKAETSEEQRRLKARLALINDAQIAEINGFNAQLGASKSNTEQLMESLQGIPGWTGVDAKGKEVGLPGILEHPAMAAFANLFSQLLRPPASPAQQLYGGGANYYNSVNRTVNMPVYTNQSPSVMQDSAAITWAAMA